MRLRPRLLAIYTLSVALPTGAAAAIPDEPAAPPATSAPEAQWTQIRGQLRLSRGVPVIGATVLAYAVSRPGELHVTATDEKGLFKLDGLEGGTYRVEAHREGLIPLIKPGVVLRYPYRTVIEATMDKAETASPGPSASPDTNPGAASGGWLVLEGTVRGPYGAAQAEARVRLARPDASADPRVTLTGPDGTYRIQGLAPGAWDLEILGGGYLPLRVRLNLGQSMRVGATLVPHPVGHTPAPEDLMPPEEPIPPPAPSAS